MPLERDPLLARLRAAFVLPGLGDDEAARRARILNGVLLMIICLAPPVLLVNVAIGRTPPLANFMLAALALAAALLRFLLVNGQPRLAGVGTVAGVFAYAVAVSAVFGSVRSSTTALLPVDVALAGVLLGDAALVTTTLFSVGAYALLVQLEASGRLAATDLGVDLGETIGFGFLCAGVAFLTHRGLSAVRAALGRAESELQERRRVEDELERRNREQRKSEERYRLISEVMSDYTFSTQVGEDGRLRLDWVAGAFEAITGYTYDEYVARGGWFAALHEGDREQDARDLRQLRANHPVVSEVRTYTKSGSIRWVRVYAHPVWDAARGRLAGIYGAVQDITERKSVEAEREALIRELEAKNRELENFTYAASHDLRSPLITISSFLGYLEGHARSGDTAALRADVERIRAASEKMDRLLKELLELSRIGRVLNTPGSIPLADVVREAAGLVEGRLAERRIHLSVAEDLPILLADRPRLVQVLQNLLDNAAKFMGAQPDPRISVTARSESTEHVICVTDNGLGVPAKLQARLFGLFEKLDPKAEGMGVGLALVKRIVESHGGRVFMESRGEGSGSTFGFTLPTAPVKSGEKPA